MQYSENSLLFVLSSISLLRNLSECEKQNFAGEQCFTSSRKSKVNITFVSNIDCRNLFLRFALTFLILSD